MFIKPSLARLLVIISVVLLLVSLVGVFAVRAIPKEVEQKTALVNYEHNGKFDYLVTLTPSYLFGPEPQQPPPPPEPPPLTNPQFPVKIIRSFNFNFGYEVIPDRPVKAITEKVKVTAIAKGDSGKMEEITLMPETSKTGASFNISFPLVISDNNSTANIIVYVYVYPTIQTDSGLLFDSFVQKLNLNLQGPLFEVDRNLQQSELHNSGTLIYEQKGTLSYSVLLTEDNPLGVTTLLPPEVIETPAPTPTPPPPLKTVGPGEVIFPKLVDNITASFSYDLRADQPVRDESEEVQITAVLEAPKLWSKSLVLVRNTQKKGSFTIKFPIDLDQLTKTLEDIKTETGAAATSYTLAIKADVHTVGQTNFGPIDEVYSQTLSSDLGTGTLSWKEELEQSKAGSIEETKVGPNPNKYLGLSVSAVKNLPAILAGIFFLFCTFSVLMYIRLRPAQPSLIEQETRQIGKKYGQRIAEATGQTPPKGEKIISLGSMEDLIKIADELGKPIIHQAPNDTSGDLHAYCILDGATRYQYLLAIIKK